LMYRTLMETLISRWHECYAASKFRSSFTSHLEPGNADQNRWQPLAMKRRKEARMARGSIRKRQLEDGSARYDVVVDLGLDPVTGKRRQRRKTFTLKKEAQAALTAWQAEIDSGMAVDRSRQTVAELLRYWLDTYARHNVRPVTLESYE